LPYFGLARNRRNIANLLLEESIDDRGLSGVGATNESDRDLFSVSM
jgi:hypothetical protein